MITVAALPSKDAKNLPDDAKEVFAAAYNEDYGWRCSEAHALKAAWRAVLQEYTQAEDGSWTKA